MSSVQHPQVAPDAEATADDLASLFDRSGFTLTRVVPTQSALAVLEARRK
jgi:hypothetical protein